MTEHDIQEKIKVALSEYGVIFRINVGTGKTLDGRYFNTGVPPGFSDLFGVKAPEGRAVFIEVKKPGGVIRPQQQHFIEQMKSYGAIAGICYSVEEALKLIK